MTEKETYSDFNFGSYGSSQMGSTNIDDVIEEEKKLKSTSTTFTIVGLVGLVAGLALFLPLATIGGEGLLVGAVIAGIFATVFGGIKLLRESNKKSLDFPKLRINRKSNKSAAMSKPFEETSYVRKKLMKSKGNRVFFGVAGGLADYSGIPATLTRLFFILAFFITGGAIAVPYFLLALLMPAELKGGK